MLIKEIIEELNNFAPLELQEDYDNSGLNVGNPENEISGILISLDITPEIINEAIENNCNLIISHHPLIFKGIKKITGKNDVEKSIIKAIKNDISIYCGHTNFDNHYLGVNNKIAEKLNLNNLQILDNKENIYRKISVYIPFESVEKVKNAMFETGAGKLGNYDCCSYDTIGLGSFRANEKSNPYIGEKNQIHFEKETKIEMIYPKYLENKIVSAMLSAHPYEEVAYNLINNEMKNKFSGAGIIGSFEEEITEIQLFEKLKSKFEISNIRHTKLLNKKIGKIAICGGSGAFLINNAIQAKVQAYITADLKYHDFFLAENKILLIDIGHYESEQFTKEIFFDIIHKKNVNFAVKISQKNTNPINNY
ncbi:MAG: Nif3-like dinuclear metal center hexameric protein [Bacteroidales bacterium]|jgi:dinuclear metal center YbgI/SA1388 family protein|nr:Nif3-like dinuclear metal center hexameric protein [Bacteroidales bacterium]